MPTTLAPVHKLRLQLLYHAIEGSVGYRNGHLGKEDQELVQGYQVAALHAISGKDIGSDSESNCGWSGKVHRQRVQQFKVTPVYARAAETFDRQKFWRALP